MFSYIRAGRKQQPQKVHDAQENPVVHRDDECTQDSHQPQQEAHDDDD